MAWRLEFHETKETGGKMKEKTMQQIWIGSGLRVARHVALSTLLLSGVNHAALAQALPTAQTIPLASAQFDKSLLTPVDHVLDKTGGF